MGDTGEAGEQVLRGLAPLPRSVSPSLNPSLCSSCPSSGLACSSRRAGEGLIAFSASLEVSSSAAQPRLVLSFSAYRCSCCGGMNGMAVGTP